MMRKEIHSKMTKLLLVLIWVQARTTFGFCPRGCDCDDIRLKVVCTNSTLDVLPIALNTRIEYIRMSYNKIRIVDASFQFYEHLISIDLSSNIVDNIEDKSFAAQRSLVRLSLAKNKISDLSPKVFIGLTRLNHLSLRANQLQFIRLGVLEHLKSLVSLDLGENKITNLEPNIFIGNRMLEKLLMDSNEMNHIPISSFTHCQQLSSLDMSDNNLTSLHNQTFSIVTRLSHLNLSHCSLATLSAISLRNLSSLTSLDLSHNNLRSVPTSQLSGLSSLKSLVLSGNNFAMLGPHSFRELHKLQQLYVNNCPLLSQVQVAAFHNNLDLRVVDLSNNPNLHEVKPFAFPQILQLSHLSLANTSIVTLRSDAVPWERLGYLDLSNTWLSCDCDLAWMTRVPVHGARCGGPSSVRGAYLRTLSLTSLGCGPGLQPEVVVVGVGCVVLISIVLIISILCCTCRNKIKHIATCTVSATETTYKNSYDNCVYLGKMQGYLTAESDVEKAKTSNHIPSTLTCNLASEDHLSHLKALCVEATPL